MQPLELEKDFKQPAVDLGIATRLLRRGSILISS